MHFLIPNSYFLIGQFFGHLVAGEAFDLSANVAKLFVKIFVTAVEVVNALHPRFAARSEAGHDEGGAGSEVRGHDWGPGQRSPPFDDGVGAFDGDVCPHTL